RRREAAARRAGAPHLRGDQPDPGADGHQGHAGRHHQAAAGVLHGPGPGALAVDDGARRARAAGGGARVPGHVGPAAHRPPPAGRQGAFGARQAGHLVAQRDPRALEPPGRLLVRAAARRAADPPARRSRDLARPAGPEPAPSRARPAAGPVPGPRRAARPLPARRDQADRRPAAGTLARQRGCRTAARVMAAVDLLLGARHLPRQRRVIAAVLDTAARSLWRARNGHAVRPPPALPGPELTDQVTAPSIALVRDYLRHLGAGADAYRHPATVPPHLFPQWTFPIVARVLRDVPYPLARILNAGCRLEVNAAVPASAPLTIRAQLMDVEDDGRRALLHQRVVTGTRSNPDALVAHLYAVARLPSRGAADGAGSG